MRLGFIYQSLGDKFQSTDHGLQFAITTEADLKTVTTTASGIAMDFHVCAGCILNTKIGASAMTGSATVITGSYITQWR